MKAEEARTYKEQVLSDFISGQSAKAISKKYKMHERHVKMILDESGIDAFEEYKRRLADGTYAHLLSHQQKDPEAWYKARFGKTRKEFAEERERKQREQQEKVERSQAARCLISVLKATAKAKKRTRKT